MEVCLKYNIIIIITIINIICVNILNKNNKYIMILKINIIHKLQGEGPPFLHLLAKRYWCRIIY